MPFTIRYFVRVTTYGGEIEMFNGQIVDGSLILAREQETNALYVQAFVPRLRDEIMLQGIKCEVDNVRWDYDSGIVRVYCKMARTQRNYY